MKIIVKGSHIDITEAIHDYLSRKLQAIEKFLDEVAIVEADLGKTTNHHKHGDIFRAELNITNKGDYTRVVAESGDLYAAIDLVKDEAHNALNSKKDKKRSLFKKGAMKLKQIFKRGE